MPILAWIVEALVWVFRSRVGLIILQILVWMGITYGTQKVVIQPTIDQLKGYMAGMGASTGIGLAAFHWLGVLKFDVACTMIISAYVTRAGVGAAKIAIMKKS